MQQLDPAVPDDTRGSLAARIPAECVVWHAGGTKTQIVPLTGYLDQCHVRMFALGHEIVARIDEHPAPVEDRPAVVQIELLDRNPAAGLDRVDPETVNPHGAPNGRPFHVS